MPMPCISTLYSAIYMGQSAYINLRQLTDCIIAHLWSCPDPIEGREQSSSGCHNYGQDAGAGAGDNFGLQWMPCCGSVGFGSDADGETIVRIMSLLQALLMGHLDTSEAVGWIWWDESWKWKALNQILRVLHNTLNYYIHAKWMREPKNISWLMKRRD